MATARGGTARDGGGAVDASAAAAALFAGPGEMRARCRALDWAATPLGAVDTWAPALCAAVRLALETPFAACLWCGPAYVLLYNDAFRRVFGAKHPVALGRPGAQVWDEAWAQLGPQLDGVRAGSPPAVFEDLRFVLGRLDGGASEEAWFTYAFVPVRDEAGAVVAVYNPATETTAHVRAEAERARLFAALEAERAELAAANAALRNRQRELERANLQLQEQAAELEATADELQATAAHLEEQTEAADRARRAADAARTVAEAAESRIAAVLAQAPVSIVVTEGPEHRFTLVNAQAEAFTRRGDLVGQRYVDAYPELADSLVVLLDRVYATGEPVVTGGVRVAFARPGSAGASAETGYDELSLDLVFHPLRAPGADGRVTGPGAGPVTGILHFAMDVTTRERAGAEREHLLVAEREARADAEAAGTRSDAVLASIADAFYLLDRDWRFTHVNDAAEPLLQTTREALLGRTLWEAFPDVVGSVFEGPYREAMATGRVTSAEAYFEPLGTWFDVRTYPWTGGVMVHFRDIGARKAAEAERERLLADAQAARVEAERHRAAAEAANAAKSQFLSMMSHELRTPLNAIGGYAELMEMGIRGPVSDAQRQDLGRIQQSQRHLLGLVNEVLDLAKVDAGALRVGSAPVRAGDTIDAALALVRPQAAAKVLSLTETTDGAADGSYLGDEPRVRQVLVNLLSNAIKFTPPGGQITVGCTLTDAPPPGRGQVPGTPYLAIWVEDTGVGIAANQLERVFEPFTQLDSGANPYTRPAGGTGLGLPISQRLARLMGGDLTVASRVGHGSVFTLWLPAHERRAMPREMPDGGTEGALNRAPSLAPTELAASLTRIGAALTTEAGVVIGAWSTRLRADPLIPTAGRTDVELEDHAATLVTDAGLALRTLGESGGESRDEAGELLRDSRAILAVLAERHGAQRARLGWPEAAIPREFALLSEVLHDTARRLIGAPDLAATERVHAVIAQILTQAERVSLGGYRLAAVAERRS